MLTQDNLVTKDDDDDDVPELLIIQDVLDNPAFNCLNNLDMTSVFTSETCLKSIFFTNQIQFQFRTFQLLN